MKDLQIGDFYDFNENIVYYITEHPSEADWSLVIDIDVQLYTFLRSDGKIQVRMKVNNFYY